MTRQQLISSVEETFKECIEIIKKKNVDYASQEDAIKNFRAGEIIDITAYKSILNRIVEKIVRVSNLENQQASVKDEAVEDTLCDIINLAAILKAHLGCDAV